MTTIVVLSHYPPTMKVLFVALLPFFTTHAMVAESSSYIYACFDNPLQEGFGEAAGSPNTMYVRLHHVNHDYRLVGVYNITVTSSTVSEDGVVVVDTSCDSTICDIELSVENLDPNLLSETGLAGNATVEEVSSLKGGIKESNPINLPFSVSLEYQSGLCTHKEEERVEVNTTKVVLVVLALTIILAVCCYMATAQKEVIF